MLDPAGRQEVLQTVSRLNREKGMTVVLITHHMDEAELADRVVVVDHGRVVMDGTPREIFSQPDKLKALRLTVPATVELLHNLRQQGWKLPADLISVEECAQAIGKALQGKD